MNKKLYLHIGTPKTGTTAIQAFCFINRDLLENEGVYYPVEVEAADLDDAALPQAGNVYLIFHSSMNINEKTEQLWNLIKRYDKVIISSESIYIDNYESLADIINGLYKLDNTMEINVIIYLRNQADYFESWYRECVKNSSYTISYIDILKHFLGNSCLSLDENDLVLMGWNSCNYYKAIVSINKALRGKGNLHIRNYDQLKAARKDIIENFFEIIGVNISDKYKRSKHWANPSLDVKMLEVRRIINTYKSFYSWEELDSLFMSPSFRRWLSEEASRKGVTEIESYATDEWRQQIWDRFREDNKRISIEFLGKDEDLFPAPVNRGAVSLEGKDYWKEAVLILSGGCLAVNRKNQHLENKINQLEDQIKSLQSTLSNYNDNPHHNEFSYEEAVQTLHDMTNSRSWKLTVPLRQMNRILKIFR